MWLNKVKERFKQADTNAPTPKFQIMSDLHLELMKNYLDFDIPPTAPYLILAGDIGRFSQYEQMEAFISHQCSRFERVFLVLGNHEFYGLSRDHGLKAAERLRETIGTKLTILNRGAYDMPDHDLLILGCTLQSYIPDEARAIVQSKVADFRHIDGWTVDHHNEEHARDVEWLKSAMSSNKNSGSNRKILIVTHHAPSFEKTSAPQHYKNPWSSAFCTDILGTETQRWEGIENAKMWVFGHTHWCADFWVGSIRAVSNQRGYVFGVKPVEPAQTKNRLFFKRRRVEDTTAFQVTKTVQILPG